MGNSALIYETQAASYIHNSNNTGDAVMFETAASCTF